MNTHKRLALAIWGSIYLCAREEEEEEEEEEEDNNNNNNNNNNDGERREHVVERVYEESGVG